MRLPVMQYAPGAGWQVVGHASSLKAAERVVCRHLPDTSRHLIDRCGFSLRVWERDAFAREINGGPAGYVWSVGK